MNGKKEKGKKRIKAKKRKKRKKESGAVLRYMERSRSHGSRHPWGLVLEQFLRDEHCGMELCWSSSWRAVTCGKATHDQCEMEDVPRQGTHVDQSDYGWVAERVRDIQQPHSHFAVPLKKKWEGGWWEKYFWSLFLVLTNLLVVGNKL